MNTARALLIAAIALGPLAAYGQATETPPHDHNGITNASDASRPAPVPSSITTSDVKQWFERLKALAGSWQGAMITEPHQPQMAGVEGTVTIRATSRGNAIMHNMRNSRIPDDPITMIYLENDRLLLTHYCDAGNRPRMQGTISPDGKVLTFDFVDMTGPTNYGHMNRAVFTFVDDNHHIEEWTYVLPNGNRVRARSELRRTGGQTAASDQ